MDWKPEPTTTTERNNENKPEIDKTETVDDEKPEVKPEPMALKVAGTEKATTEVAKPKGLI